MPGTPYSAQRIGSAGGGHALHGLQHAGPAAAGHLRGDRQKAMRRAGHHPGSVFQHAGIRRFGTGDTIIRKPPRREAFFVGFRAPTASGPPGRGW